MSIRLKKKNYEIMCEKKNENCSMKKFDYMRSQVNNFKVFY